MADGVFPASSWPTSTFLLLPILIPTAIYVAGLLFSCLKEAVQSRAGGGGGPPVAGTLLDLLLNFSTIFDYLTCKARKHQTFCLVGFPFHRRIYTSHPANVEHMLKTNFSNYIKGEYICTILKELFGDGIFLAEGERWRYWRKMASYEFSTRNLRDFSSVAFRENAVKLAHKIADAAAANKAIEMQELLMKTTLDSIFKVGFGVDIDSQSLRRDGFKIGREFTEAFEDVNSRVVWRFVDVCWKLKKFLNVGSEAALSRSVKLMDDVLFSFIKSRRESQMKADRSSEKNREDLLSRFLMESEKDPKNMSDGSLRDIILNFIAAGRDSTADTMSWFFYVVCKIPVVQEKIAQEVEEATDAGNLQASSMAEFAARLTEEALESMNYLRATLSETLRLYPAVPVDAKIAVEDDLLPDGCWVRKGDMVNYMPYAMGRMTYIWGTDAEEFRPERWLGDDGLFKPESPFKFTAFQGGPRICLGKEFAYRQMMIVAALLLHFFRFRLEDESREPKYKVRITLHMAGGLHLQATPRLHT